jgi:type VI secretion system secreted protein VgrG
MIHIPRIGQEVIVDFMDGDVNNPIVVASVYNAEQMPPYTLPENKTQSGILTRSTLGGTSETCNEIRFEDKKGSELLFVHAEKDRTIEVEHDETHTVQHDRTKTVWNNETTVIRDGNRTETIKKGNEALTIEKGNRTEEIQTGNDSLKISMGNRETKIGMGNDSTKLDLGKSETEAMQSIELKVGQSSVKLDQMGVTIKGMMIKIEGQVQVDVKGLMTTVSADAMLTAKGAITLIN